MCRRYSDLSRKKEAEETSEPGRDAYGTGCEEHVLVCRVVLQCDEVLGVLVPAWAAVPLIETLAPGFVYPLRSMAGKVDDSGRNANKRESEE